MADAPTDPKDGRCFEELRIGDRFESAEVEITRESIQDFADLTHDRHPLHTDPDFARGTQFGDVIAHGLHGLALMGGLKAEMSIYGKHGLASLGWDRVRFRKPLYPGDRVRSRVLIVRMRPMKAPSRGIVWQRVELVNQDGATVCEGVHAALVARRPE